MSTNRLPAKSVIGLAIALSACAPRSGEDVGTAEGRSVGDIASMTARGDGTFDVTCTDGRHEIATAEDVRADRVCRKQTAPSSPFASLACAGVPLTEDAARARLDAGAAPSIVGTFSFALRHREAGPAASRWTLDYRWVDAPNDALVAYRETGVWTTSGQKAQFPNTGSVELAADASGAPYLRLVGDAAHVVGPDTTHRMRLVSKPMRPWAQVDVVPDFDIEEAQGDSAWAPVRDYGYSVETEDRPFGRSRTWWLSGPEVTAFATRSCAQFVSPQSTAETSPVDLAIGIYASLSL